MGNRNTNFFLEIRNMNGKKYQLEAWLLKTIWPLCNCLLFMVEVTKS